MEYKNPENPSHNLDINHESQNLSKVPQCLIATTMLLFVSPCILFSCYTCYLFFILPAYADVLRPEPYPQSESLGRTGYGGSDSIWTESWYCSDEDALTIVDYYESSWSLISWSFDKTKFSDGSIAWRDTQEDIVYRIFGGYSASAWVNIYPLDETGNEKFKQSCDKKTYYTLGKDWYAQ